MSHHINMLKNIKVNTKVKKKVILGKLTIALYSIFSHHQSKNSSHRCISSQEAYSFILFLHWTPIDYLWPRNKGEESEKGFLRDGGGDTKVVFDKFDSKFWSSRFTLAPWQRWFWNYWAVDVERLPELETLLPELASLWGLCHSVLLWCPVPLLYKGWFIEH